MKPRNTIVRNAKPCGAGRHLDKRKREQSRKPKHKHRG